jgi:hypothetical protein
MSLFPCVRTGSVVVRVDDEMNSGTMRTCYANFITPVTGPYPVTRFINVGRNKRSALRHQTINLKHRPHRLLR